MNTFFFNASNSTFAYNREGIAWHIKKGENIKFIQDMKKWNQLRETIIHQVEIERYAYESKFFQQDP